MNAGKLLDPVVGAMRTDLLRASYLQVDETTVPVVGLSTTGSLKGTLERVKTESLQGNSSVF